MEWLAARILSVLCAALLAVSCASGPSQPPEAAAAGRFDAVRAEMTSLIRREMRADKVTSLAIALVDGQETVWEQGFGYSNLEARVPVTPDTLFCVGSVSKLFTATAILQLVEEGKIALDAPLADTLPGFSVKTRFPEAGPITIRSLLTHHAGLPGEFLMLGSRPSLGRDRWFSRTVELLKDTYVTNPPGFLYSYSNIGFDLLGSVIEKASGVGFERYMRERLLAPLGMHGASYASSSLDPELTALAYAGGKPNGDLSIDGDPAGGLWGSARDVGAFIKMVLADGTTASGPILRPETVAQMLRPQNAGTPMDLDLRTGLAWELGEIAGSPTAGHNGDAMCYHSSLLILPEERLGVFVTSSSSESMKLVRNLADTTLRRALEVKTGKVEQGPAAKTEKTVQLSAEELESLPGYYATEIGVVNVTARNKSLWIRLQGNELKLVPRPGRRFSPQFLLFGLIPVKLPMLASAPWFGFSTLQGHAVVTQVVDGKSSVFGEKMSPGAIPEAWESRVGAWAPVDPAGPDDLPLSVRLRREAELLVLDILIGGNTLAVWALSPLGDGEALIAGMGRNMGETIWAKSSAGEERLVFSGFEFRKSAD